MSTILHRVSLKHFFVAAACLVLAACSASGPASGQGTTVQVTLTDFTITSSLSTFSVGVPYHFVVANKGSQAHEFVIMPPASDPATLDAQRKLAIASLSGQDLPAGGTKTLDVTFTQAAPTGTLEFACHLPGHYEAGMRLPIVVK